jgi:hypothetical protein
MNYAHSDACFSDDAKYRWCLTRVWDSSKPTVCFIGLNPSTAGAKQDDNTIRKEVAFSDRWGYGRLEKVNLFGYCSTDPKKLRTLSRAEAIGIDNNQFIRRVTLSSQMIVAAWGRDGALFDRATEVLKLLREEGHQVYCLGVCANRQPKHSLYLSGHLEPQILHMRPPPVRVG